MSSPQSARRRPISVIRAFLDNSASGGIVLMLAALAALIVDIAQINVWNRLNAATRQPSGQTWF